jgi:hypothetical protein
VHSRRQLAGLGAVLLWTLALPAAGDDVGELGGFGEEDEEFSVEIPPEEEREPVVPQRWWDLDGSVAISTSWNYLSHRSAAPPPNGTDYTGLSRLRTRLNLQLDLELPRDFEIRVSPYIWYDFNYLIHGIGSYTERVIDEYEWEGDFQDSYLQGPILEDLDVKIGRQVVNWGRSDSLRVLDVLNPLDNREPGRADIEDLRWAIGMLKLDYYLGPWTFTGIAIPEMRFDDLPPVGSDFNPLPSQQLNPRTEEPNSFEDWEFAARIGGIFEGWDVSFHFAYIYQDLPSLRVVPVGPGSPLGLIQKHSRLFMAGAGGNYTMGPWLFKAEAAWFDGIRVTRCEPQPCEVPPFTLTTDPDRFQRFDGMLGVEYYGFSETTIAIEVVDRHLFGHDDLVVGFPTFQREDSTSYAIRYTADWLNARLQTTVLAILQGYKVQDGAVIRAQADYTLRDGLVLTGGILIFEAGDLPPLSDWGSNDRVFVDVKWSF